MSAGRGQSAGAEGPYCLVLQAEGVGNVSMQINRPPPAPPGAGQEGERPLASSNEPITYTRSNPTGVAWIDICAQPNSRRIAPMVDDRQEQIPEGGAPPIPFPIRFYDQPVTPPLMVSSNGWMSFLPHQGGALSGFTLAGTVPSPTEPNAVVAPYWRDLHTRYSGICYGTTGSPGNRRFVIQWQDLHYCCTDDPAVHLTFEVVIHELRRSQRNNIIDVVYQTMQGATSAGAGIENHDGTQGVTIPTPFTAPQVVRFAPSR